MYLFKKVEDLQAYLSRHQKTHTPSIGYVPTMGALHQGHLELIRQSKETCALTVCSIFVNPTQFGDASDLDNYPRPIETDIEQLEAAGCEVLFLPSVAEVYPQDIAAFRLDLQGLDQTMEGASRPGHFDGVVQVVHRLLDIVQPSHLFMGQKDYQQFAVIKYMLQQMRSAIQLVRVPIVREEDGLAMSSRNVRLSEIGRKQATYISKALRQAKKDVAEYTLEETKARAVAFLIANGMDIDYFEIVDGDTLKSVSDWDDAPIITACTVVQVDGVRLLDNKVLKELEVG